MATRDPKKGIGSDPAVEDADQDLKASENTIDPRLDNRTGDQRPPLETFPAKPQQIDGPDLAHTPTVRQVVEFIEKQHEEDDETRKGMASPGPHGLGATYAVPFKEATDMETGVKAEEEKSSNDPKKDTK